MERKEYQTVVLAGLLHDIGKFLQRGSFGSLDIKGKHPQVSGVFVSAYESLFAPVADVSLLKTLLERHHEHPSFRPDLSVQDLPPGRTRMLAYLISEADNLSSSERGEHQKQYQDYKTIPLAPVFGQVSLGGGGKATNLRYHPQPLESPPSLEAVFPEDLAEYPYGEMNDLLTSFGEEFRKLSSVIDKTDFNCVLTHLMGVLYKYTWCIPANTQEKTPDVSLYDHLKTTAAIAACLYRYHVATDTLDERHIKANGERFRLVVGDLSGIQKYIFDIATVRVGGVARRLRARSLFVQMVIEVVCHKILKEFGLTPSNVIMSSGGKFYMLLPNIEQAERKVKQIQQEVDNRLLNQLNGELALNLASISFGDEGFKTEEKATGFGKVVEELHRELRKRKQHRFSEALITADSWQEKEFLRQVYFEGERVCHSCRKFPQEKEELCTDCLRDREMGAKLPQAKYISFYSKVSEGKIPILDYSVSIASDMSELPPSPYLMLKLNSLEMEERDYHYPALFKYIATHIPEARGCDACEKASTCEAREEQKDQKDLATFGCLAHQTKGRPLLGFLKADVDNLGALFQFGLKRNPPAQNWDTISRLSTLSRQIDLFFNGWIEHLSRTEFPNCYTVFSGGDDLFFVGPWDSMLSFAERVRNDFTRYTQNTEMTLSAGIAINKHRHPIARAAPDADELLEESKHKGRNRLTLLGHTVKWSDWEIIKAQWELLRGHLHEIPSAFLYSLLQYAKMWREYLRGNTLGLRFQPLLAYNLVRNVNAQRNREVFEWAEELATLRPGDDGQKVILDNLGLIAQLLILEKGGR